ncbi:MAG: helix-turn-helix domain-containing protein [Chloroflexota bacterium]
MPSKPNPIEDRKEEYVTIKEAADHLRVSLRSIYRWLNQGNLKYFRAGRSTRILLSELDRFISENTRLGKEE